MSQKSILSIKGTSMEATCRMLSPILVVAIVGALNIAAVGSMPYIQVLVPAGISRLGAARFRPATTTALTMGRGPRDAQIR